MNGIWPGAVNEDASSACAGSMTVRANSAICAGLKAGSSKSRKHSATIELCWMTEIMDVILEVGLEGF